MQFPLMRPRYTANLTNSLGLHIIVTRLPPTETRYTANGEKVIYPPVHANTYDAKKKLYTQNILMNG